MSLRASRWPDEKGAWNLRTLTALTGCALLWAGVGAAGAVTHDREFWLALRVAEYRLPAAAPVLPLALEAASLLGSTDPGLRDGVAYEALAEWVYANQRLDAGERAELLAVMTANARRGLGEPEGDGLFLRSFSALALSLFAAADFKRPTLDPAQFDSQVDLGTLLLAGERDLRGYVAGKGWGHATAHTADLLKFLGRNPRLKRLQQQRMVVAIRGRLRSAGQVFAWGEDARLAAALASLARRADVDPAPFSEWFGSIVAEHVAVWTGELQPARYVAERAELNALAHLATELDADTVSAGTQAIRGGLRAMRAATR